MSRCAAREVEWHENAGFCHTKRQGNAADKLNLVFGIGFPVIVLLLLSLIQSNIPVDLFEIEQLAPGIAVFGLSFISLFSGMLIAKDRTGAFMSTIVYLTD